MDQQRFIESLRATVGRRHVLVSAVSKAPFCRGFRFGDGTALAVVRPGSLLEFWNLLTLCVEHGVAVIVQAANTGLTGGSTPLPSYDRPAVVISTLRIDRVVLIRQNRQAVCLAGSTLQGLEQKLKETGRQPHSVLGSSCIGASVVGGVCNNSGGALVERGPAFTEYALFARVTEEHGLELVNALGIDLGNTPEEILSRLDRAAFGEDNISEDHRRASATDYSTRVRDTESDQPARYNADPQWLHEASGCAGKLAVFTVRLDTFEAPRREQTFFLSTNDPEQLARLRRRILAELHTLPVSAEYIHRDTLELARKYGNDTVWIIDKLGTGRLPLLYRIRRWTEAMTTRFLGLPDTLIERTLQLLGRMLPSRIPEPVDTAMSNHRHHLILKTRDTGIGEAEALLDEMRGDDGLQIYRCSQREAELISLYRFAAAGAAIRYEACHRQATAGIVALDIALPRNTRDWLEKLPADLDQRIEKKLYYGHFLCHVMHQDYIVRAGEDCAQVKKELLEFTRARGARYPAEHNHGHLYEAPGHVKAFYRSCDPTNTFNPGVGRMSARLHYSEPS